MHLFPPSIVGLETRMDLAEFARKIPKAELHVHLEGAILPGTLAELANKYNVELPPHDEVTDLYDYKDLADFLTIYAQAAKCVREVEDFRRITFECLAASAAGGGRYMELFFSPGAHLDYGVGYSTMLTGILEGMKDAEADSGIFSRLIPAHNRELGPEKGMAFLDMVLTEKPDEVIGIGLDYDEAPYPPAPYKEMYERARAAGLHVTAHAGESGPAENVRNSLDILGCERIDHGYHVVDDAALVAQCKAAGTHFTCCPSTTVYTTIWKDLTAADHPIRVMQEAGLNISLNTDDPPMMHTNIAREYLIGARDFGFTPETLKEISLNSVRASWLDEERKAALTSEWSAEIDGLIETLEPVNA